MIEQADPFATAAIRERVLRSWVEAPSRLREDANSEDDLVHGGYRERLVVELAQNAADAAALAAGPGRVLLRLEPEALIAANTGAPLDAAGVLGLATLRASAKRDDEVTGRFGVGFAAVLAVTDEPVVIGRSGGVRFSRAQTLDLVRAAADPGLAAELARRQDRVPALRLPFPAGDDAASGGSTVRSWLGAPPEGYDTVVVLPLRDARAHRLADRLLEELDDALLLALPALDEVVVERPGHPARRLADVRSRWLVHSHSGRHRDADLAQLPVEDRSRSRLEVTWAVPFESTRSDWAAVVHAPTPTAEPLPWPVMLLAQLPLEPDRRTVHPGPVADAVIAAAAGAFVELAERLTLDAEQAREPGGAAPLGGRVALDLLPSPSQALPAGWFDAALREAVIAALRSARILRRAGDAGAAGDAGGEPDAVRPRDAVVLEGPGADNPELLTALGARFENLVEVPPRHAALLRMLGVARAQPAELVGQWSGPPAQVRDWLTALAPVAGDPAAREALAAISVPVLTEDGDVRTVRGARGTLLVEPAIESSVLQVLARYGVRIVAPQVAGDPAIADLLVRLGAGRSDAPGLLADPAVVAAVRASTDDPDGAGLTEAVLTLVERCLDVGHDVGELTWLGELAVPDADGDLVPAALLVQPGSPMAGLVDPQEAGFAGADLVGRWPADVLQAVGVASRPVLLRAEDVDLLDIAASGELPGRQPGAGELDGLADWAGAVLDSVGRSGRASRPLAARVDGELVAVRGLDLVTGDRLAELVDLLLADPSSRRALVEPVRVVVDGLIDSGGDSGGEPAGAWQGRWPSYTAWWLRDEIGSATSGLGTDPVLAGLLPAAPGWVDRLDREVAAALGVVHDWADLNAAGAAGWRLVLDRLDAAADQAPPDPVTLLRVWAGLGAVEPGIGGAGIDASTGGTIWALDAELRPVRSDDPALADDPVVVDGPQWLQRRDLAPFVVPAAGTAGRLAELLDLDLASARAAGRVTSEGMPSDVPTTVTASWAGVPRRWVEHDDLRVDGVGVDWWVDTAGDGEVHAATTDGLARALAWAGRCWSARQAIAAALAADPAAVALLVDDSF